MNKKTENVLYVKASSCFDSLKLANIKVRITLDKLFELLSQAQDLKKKSMEEFQARA